jgi:hypothetical protein
MISAIDVLRFISINPRRIWWKKIDEEKITILLFFKLFT